MPGSHQTSIHDLRLVTNDDQQHDTHDGDTGCVTVSLTLGLQQQQKHNTQDGDDRENIAFDCGSCSTERAGS